MTDTMSDALSTLADTLSAVGSVSFAPALCDAIANIATPTIPNVFCDPEVIICPAAR